MLLQQWRGTWGRSFAASPVNPNSQWEGWGRLRQKTAALCFPWKERGVSRCFTCPSLQDHLPALSHCKTICLPSSVVAHHGQLHDCLHSCCFVCLCTEACHFTFSPFSFSFFLSFFFLFFFSQIHCGSLWERCLSHLHFQDKKLASSAAIAVCFAALFFILEILVL